MGGDPLDDLCPAVLGLFEDAFDGGAVKLHHLLFCHHLVFFGHLLFFGGLLDDFLAEAAGLFLRLAFVHLLVGHVLFVGHGLLVGHGLGGLGLAGVVVAVVAAAGRCDEREREEQR